jgi:hypothetical protein
MDCVAELLKLVIEEGVRKAMGLYHNKELLEG